MWCAALAGGGADFNTKRNMLPLISLPLDVAPAPAWPRQVVTHQHTTIRRAVDRLVFLHKGKVAWEGHTDAFSDSNPEPIVRQFATGNLAGPIKLEVLEQPPADEEADFPGQSVKKLEAKL